MVAPAAAPETFANTFVRATSLVTAAIVAPLAAIVCFFWLLRRHSRRFGPLFRIDYVGNSAGVVTGPFTAKAPLVQDDTQSPFPLDRSGNLDALQGESPGPREPQPEHVPETFDVGPTFEQLHNCSKRKPNSRKKRFCNICSKKTCGCVKK